MKNPVPYAARADVEQSELEELTAKMRAESERAAEMAREIEESRRRRLKEEEEMKKVPAAR